MIVDNWWLVLQLLYEGFIQLLLNHLSGALTGVVEVDRIGRNSPFDSSVEATEPVDCIIIV